MMSKTHKGSQPTNGSHSNRRSRKIVPTPVTNEDLVEIRKKRTLRIIHLNARKRDEKLEKEVQVYLSYTRNGLPQTHNQANKTETPGIHNSEVSKVNSSRTLPPGVIEHETTGKGRSDVIEKDNAPSKEEIILDRKTAEFSNIGDAQNMETEYIQSKSIQQNVGTRETVSSLSQDTLSSQAGRKTVMSSSSITVSMDASANKDQSDKYHDNLRNITNIDETEELASSRSSQSKKPSSGKSENSKSKGLVMHHNNTQAESDSNLSGIVYKTSKDTAAMKDRPCDTKDTPREVLFFIHGVGGSSDVWKPQLDRFSALGYEVVCPDLIGHGLSCAPDDPKAYHFKEILADVKGVFDKYCKEKNIIIGHSYGCAFATVLARQRVRRVSKLILVSGGGPVPLAPQTGVFSLPLCMLTCIKPCITSLFKRSAFHSTSRELQRKRAAFDIPSYVLSYVMNGQWWLDGDELFHSWLNLPVLLVWGRHDKLVDLEEEEDMLRVVYGSKLEIIEEAGHMVMMEAAQEFNNIMYSFITDSSPPGDLSNHSQELADLANQLVTKKEGDDRVKDQSVEWASPRTKTVTRTGSGASLGSIHSYKSYKSSKSMPQGVLSHHHHHHHQQQSKQ